MARPAKIVQHELEHELLRCRERGLTLDAIVEHLNSVLAGRGAGTTVSRNAVTRYLASLGKATVAPAHTPQIATQNAMTVMHAGDELVALYQRVKRWSDEADAERNWPARVAVARELREQLRLYATFVETIYNADQVRVFQEVMLAAIADADSTTAIRIVDELQRRHSTRCAALVGP